MIFTEQAMLDSVFKSAYSSGSVGRVQALSLGRECVPIVLGGLKFLMVFNQPLFLRGESFFKESLYVDFDGDYFIPKLDHRVMSIWSGVDAENEWSELCVLDSSYRTKELSRVLQCALFIYFERYPNVDQYFYQSDEQFANFIQGEVLCSDGALSSCCSVEVVDQLAAPFHGFIITRTR